MGENSIRDRAEKPDVQSEHKNASDKLLLSLTQSDLLHDSTNVTPSNSHKTLESIAQYKAGRYALVTAEGLSLLPSGVLNGVQHNFDHPREFATKMGTAALMGVGMRVLLPEAGAARAVVGTAMSYFMARDVIAPVAHAWSQVSDRTDLSNIHDAATRMSNGLGLFTVDMVAGLPVGMAADKLTGYALTNTSAGRTFEGWKETFYNSNSSPAGRFFNWTRDASDNAAARLADRANKLADRAEGVEKAPPLTLEEKLRLIKEGGGTDGKALTVDQKLERLKNTLDDSSKLSPDAEAAFKSYLEHKRLHNQDFQEKIDQLLNGKNAAADNGQKPGSAADSLPMAEAKGAKLASLPPIKDAPPAPDTTKASQAGEMTDKPLLPLPALDKEASTVAQMSETVRDMAAKVSDVDKKIANFREGVESSLTQAMRSGKAPLDQGHFENNKSLIELAGQLQTPDHVKQAGFLLEHHKVADSQMAIPDQMPEIVDLNQYSRSVHKNLMDLLIKEGIDPSTVMRGTNSPIFLIFDDKGAGPYTIPAIKGVSDTAVVVLPREYQQMLGVHVSGVYAHELGHDLIYGDLLRFPENLRDKVLRQDVVAEAMKSKGIADTDIEIPGFGNMKKSEFFTKLLLAEANENTADIFGTAIDPNTPLSLSTLLGSLRKPLEGAPEGSRGALETRSMYGSDYANPTSNPLGIEPHGIDAWRVKLGAEVLRQLSHNNSRVAAYANRLDQLSDSLRRPGDNYVWAAMDNEGKAVSVPIKEWDAIIPSIVKAQLETPLPALNNKMLRDVYPDMAEIYPRVDTLSEQVANSARAGDRTVDAFSKAAHPIEDVYSAGLSGWMKAIEKNPAPGQPGYVAPDVLLERINGISSSLTSLYRLDNYLPPPVWAPTGVYSVFVGKPLGHLGHGIGQLAGSAPQVREMFSSWANKSSIYAGVSLTRDMFETEQRLQELAARQQKSN